MFWIFYMEHRDGGSFIGVLFRILKKDKHGILKKDQHDCHLVNILL